MNARLYIAADIHDVRRLHRDLLEQYPDDLTVLEVLRRQADTLLTAHGGGDAAISIQVRSWLPGFARKSAEEILAVPLTIDDMRLVAAREHGFDDWAQATNEGNLLLDPTFEEAVDAVVSGDLPALERLVFANPWLVVARSRYGHRATLLHYVAANGVETWRQTVPRIAPEIVRFLITAGADPATTAHFYGAEYMPAPLVATSAHPSKAGVTEAILKALETAM